MKRNLWSVFAAVVLVAGCNKPSEQGGGGAVKLETDDQKTLYALGQSIGGSISVFDLKPEELRIVQQGISDKVEGKKAQVDVEQYGPKIQTLARTRSQVLVTKEKEKSTSFLAEAAKEKGAEKTASGLVYIPEKEGTGPQPTANDIVKVHYRGTLMDGTEFDSSYKRNEPTQFPLNGVIKCWTEGLQKMKVGGKAKLVCPPDIAYGDRGAPPSIPGGAALTFEVELLEIVPANAPQQ